MQISKNMIRARAFPQLLKSSYEKQMSDYLEQKACPKCGKQVTINRTPGGLTWVCGLHCWLLKDTAFFEPKQIELIQ